MAVPTLFLTCSIKESEKAGVFIGRINEIPGIFAQANSPSAVHDDLVRNTHIMQRYKQDAFLALLRTQLAERFSQLVEDSPAPKFVLEIRNDIRELEAA